MNPNLQEKLIELLDKVIQILDLEIAKINKEE